MFKYKINVCSANTNAGVKMIGKQGRARPLLLTEVIDGQMEKE
jgi:hypothetical protein